MALSDNSGTDDGGWADWREIAAGVGMWGLKCCEEHQKVVREEGLALKLHDIPKIQRR